MLCMLGFVAKTAIFLLFQLIARSYVGPGTEVNGNIAVLILGCIFHRNSCIIFQSEEKNNAVHKPHLITSHSTNDTCVPHVEMPCCASIDICCKLMK